MKAKILGTGYALPDNILTNQDLEKMVDTTDQWIVERTGIKERRIAAPGQNCSDLSLDAAQKALAQAGISPSQLDLILVATTTPDMLFPSTACIVQGHLGAENAAALDLEAACTGFIYALTVAEKFLLSPDYQYVLVIGAEVFSRFIDYEDRNTSIIFGDGAGAVVLGKSQGECGVLDSCLGADGKGGHLLYMPGGGSALPPTYQTIQDRMHFLKMNGNEVYKFATKIIVEVSMKLLNRNHLTWEQIDHFVPHQANLRIIQTAMRKMKITPEKTLINIENCANISAASIPVLLAQAEEQGRIKPGDLALLVGFGAGLTYGGAIIRWGRD